MKSTMIKNKNLRALAMAGLSLSLVSAHSFAQFAEDEAKFTVTAELEDSIEVTGLNDVKLDLGSPTNDSGEVYEWQKFTVLRRGASQEAPGHFSIKASSQYGASAAKPDRHSILNQSGDELSMRIGYSDIRGSGHKLEHDKPIVNRLTTNTEDEHSLLVAFSRDQLENPKPGIYSTAVTITVAAE